jgi:hypothetical protein
VQACVVCVASVAALHLRLPAQVFKSLKNLGLCSSLLLLHTLLRALCRCPAQVLKSLEHLRLSHPLLLKSFKLLHHTSAYVSIRQRTSVYVSIRQHTSAYVSIRQHNIHQQTSEYVSISSTYAMCQHTSAYVRTRLSDPLLLKSLKHLHLAHPLLEFKVLSDSELFLAP